MSSGESSEKAEKDTRCNAGTTADFLVSQLMTLAPSMGKSKVGQ